MLAILCAPALAPVLYGLGSAVTDADAWRDIPLGGVRWSYLLRSLWIGSIIAAIATTLAVPLAQLVRRAGVRLAALLLAPVWMPAWLLYAGLNLARAPDTALGGAIMDWALPDHRWALVMLGRWLAVGSMALWSAPIAALALAAATNPDADAGDELLATERAPWWTRIAHRARMRRAGLLTAFGVVLLLTLGSAIPLHLAQVETDTIALWRALAERTPERWGGVWLGSFPQMMVAGLGAAWLVRCFGDRPAPGEQTHAHNLAPAARTTRVLACLVWSLGAIAPVVLMAISLDAWGSVPNWMAESAGAIGSSAAVAGGSGLLVGLTAVLMAGALNAESSATRRTARVLAGLGLFAFLAPGVLVGAGYARLGGRLGIDPMAVSVAAGLARSLFVGSLAALVVAGSESPEHRALRQLDAQGSAWGWVRVDPRRAARLGLGAGAGAFLLGLHEIEASVMVRPPGTGNLPQMMLDDLHYARLEQLSAGGVVIGLAAIALGALAGILLLPRSPRSGQPQPPGAVTPPV